MWEVEYTDRFEQWWSKLGVDKQSRISAAIDLLIVDSEKRTSEFYSMTACSNWRSSTRLRRPCERG